MLSAEQLAMSIGDVAPMTVPILFDSAYSLPTTDWVDGPFSQSFDTFLQSAGLKYYAERFDCDDFAREAWAHAQRCHSIGLADTLSRKETALAFGFLTYTRDDGVHHAINWYAAGLPERIYFYEPQNRRTISLSTAERMSINRLFA